MFHMIILQQTLVLESEPNSYKGGIWRPSEASKIDDLHRRFSYGS